MKDSIVMNRIKVPNVSTAPPTASKLTVNAVVDAKW